MLTPEERRRWTLILGTAGDVSEPSPLNELDRVRDEVLAALFDQVTGAGQGASAPYVAHWLSELCEVLPAPILRWVERRCWERWGPEVFLDTGRHEPDVHFAELLLQLRHRLPARVKAQAKAYVRRWAEEFLLKCQPPWLRTVRKLAAARGHLAEELDFDRTILTNLKHYQPALKAIIPATLHWKSRRRHCLGHLILCVDQSGSMMTSLAYAGLFASLLATLPSVRTSVVAYDTAVVDLSADIQRDPVETLFGINLGGGNDTARALDYCAQLVTRPGETLLVLISDLIEGELSRGMVQRLAALRGRGVRLLVLPALTDRGAPHYDQANALAIADLGIPVVVCSPGDFHQVIERLWSITPPETSPRVQPGGVRASAPG